MEKILQQYRHLNHEARRCSTREADPFGYWLIFERKRQIFCVRVSKGVAVAPYRRAKRLRMPWEKRIKWNGTTWTKFLSSRVHLWCCLSCGNKQCVNFLLIQHHLAVAIETTSNVGKVKNAVDRLGGLVLVSKLPERRHTKEMGWISSRYWSNLCQENRIQSVTSLGTKGGDGRNWIVPKECVMHKNAWRPIFCKFKIKSFLLSFWNCWYFIRHDIIGSGVAQSSPMFCGWKENTSTRLFTSELRIGSWYSSRESRLS